jgi:hypothetical protein
LARAIEPIGVTARAEVHARDRIGDGDHGVAGHEGRSLVGGFIAAGWVSFTWMQRRDDI